MACSPSSGDDEPTEQEVRTENPAVVAPALEEPPEPAPIGDRLLVLRSHQCLRRGNGWRAPEQCELRVTALYRLADELVWEHCAFAGDYAHRTLLWGELETHTILEGQQQRSTVCEMTSVTTMQPPAEHEHYPIHESFFREVAVSGVDEEIMLETLGVARWPEDIHRTRGGTSGRVRTLNAWLDDLRGTLLLPGMPGLSVEELRAYFDAQVGGEALGRADTFAPEIPLRADRHAFAQGRALRGPPMSHLSAFALLRDGERHYLLVRHDPYAAGSIMSADFRGSIRRRIIAEGLRPAEPTGEDAID